MNREVLKSMDAERIPIDRLISLLQTFALKHSARALPDLLETADAQGATNRQFLLSVLETEHAKNVKQIYQDGQNSHYEQKHLGL